MNPIRNWRIRYQLVILVAVGAVAWIGEAASAPITFNTALPVAKGEFVSRTQYIVNQSGDDPSSADRDRTSQAVAQVLGYGVSPRLAVFGVLPYVDNELKITAGGQRVTRRANGFGDLTVFGRYTVHQKDQPGRTFRVAPFFGAKAPTGEDDESDSRGRVPPSVQVGSGSWDALVGAVATYQTLRYQVDGQFSFRANNEANDFEAGDVARLDASLQYRLKPRDLAGGVPGFLYGVLEVNLIDRDKNRVSGSKDSNSGGTTLFITPGVQYITKRWIVEGAVQIPTSQDLNGTALENDFIARVSGRFNF
jgi:hypothetical protein